MHTMTSCFIGKLRYSAHWLRTVASGVLITFTGLILAPTALAAQEALKEAKPSVTASPPGDALPKALEKVEDKLARLQQRLAKKQNAVREKADLTQLRGQLVGLDKTAMADFNEVEAHLKKHKLPGIILKRHHDAVARYRKDMAALLQNLTAVELAKDESTRMVNARKAWQLLKAKQHTRPPPTFDPNDLPVQSLRPHPENKPKLKQGDFRKAGLFDHPLVKLAVNGAFTFDKLPGANDPAYLAETAEVTLSDTVKAKAAELEHNPVKIYDWVRNNIEWLPTWGAYQAADLTLSAKRGNAMEIASLTIALLRASGIPSRYVHGTIEVPKNAFINWVGDFANIDAAQDYASVGGIPTTSVTSGGQITKMRLEHIWVEAAIDFHPSRGAINKDADNWVRMDPSFKQYDYLQGLDPIQISGIDPQQVARDFEASGTVNEQEDWVTGFDPSILQRAQTQAQQAVRQHITDNLPNPTVGDVIGGRKTIVQEYPVLPSSLPNRIIVEGGRYATLPNALLHRMSFAFEKDIFGELTDPITYPWAKLNNQKITLSFKPATPADEQALQSLLPAGEITDVNQLPSSIPAYLINVIPELKLNGQVIKAGNPMHLGEELPLSFQVTTPLEVLAPYTFNAIAGSYLALPVMGQSVAPDKLNTLQSRLNQTKTVLESNDRAQIDALTREELVGDMFYAGALGYAAEYGALAHLAALQQRASHTTAFIYGSFGYEPLVNYFFGVPRAIEPGGVSVDVRFARYIGTHTNDPEQKKNLNVQTGVISSALEHAVPEQMFINDQNPGEAISAVKALTKANAAGQRIYHITSQNQGAALPNIHQNQLVMDEIRAALAVGKEIFTHTDPVSVPGYSGAGYIILDPETGNGAYKIAGGRNGGSSAILKDTAKILLYLASGEDLSKTFKGLAKLVGRSFGFKDDFFEILNSTGCNEGDAAVGAYLTFAVGNYLKGLSFALAASIVNPIALLVYIFVIVNLIKFVTAEIKSGIAFSCRFRSRLP